MVLFANDFQGGPAFEVFTPQGSSPLSNWKISGPGAKATKKVYEKAVKGYVFQCSGGHGFKMQLPKDDRKSMCLLQPFLCLQSFVSSGHQFSLELSVSVADNTRRRFFISSAFQEVKTTALHAQIPMPTLCRDCWANLVFHCASLVETCFRGHIFKSLDLITLGGAFKLRRIFTLKQPPEDDTRERSAGETAPIPASMSFPAGVVHQTQVIDDYALCQAPAEARSRRVSDDSVTPVGLSVQGAAAPPCKRVAQSVRRQSSRNQGSKIPGPPTKHAPASSLEPNSESAEEGRRAQSAAIQRQANSPAVEPPALQGIGASEGPGSVVRKVSSAVSSPGLRMRTRASIAPQVNLDLKVESSGASPGLASHGSPQLSPQPPAEDHTYSRSPKRAEASVSNLPAMHRPHKSGSARMLSANVQRLAEGASPCARRRSTQQGAVPALPDVLGVSAEPRLPQWASESVQVSNSSAVFKSAQNGRYSDSQLGEESVSPTREAKKYWSDMTRRAPEDVPLRHLSHSNSSRGVGSGSSSPQHPARVAPLPRSPSSNAKSIAEHTGLVVGSLSVKRTLALQLDTGASMQDSFVHLQSFGSPCSPSPHSGVNHLRFQPRNDDNESDSVDVAYAFSPSKPVLSSLNRDVPAGDSVVMGTNRSGLELQSLVTYSTENCHIQAERESAVDRTEARLEDKRFPIPNLRRLSLEHGAMSRLESNSSDSEINEKFLCEHPVPESHEVRQSEAPRTSAYYRQVTGASISSNSGPFPQHSISTPGSAAPNKIPPGEHEILDLDAMDVNLDASPADEQTHRTRFAQDLSEPERGWSLSEDADTAANMMQHQRAFTPPVVPPSRVCKPVNSILQASDGQSVPMTSATHVADADVSLRGADDDTDYRDLIYDPILNCYYDSRSNQYFAVK